MLRYPRQTKATDCNMRSGSTTLPHPQTPPVADERNPCNNAGERQPHCSTNRKGKSLCYVIPALCKNKTVLVISPIISLMVDQVQKLTKTGIRAALLGTAQKENIIQQIQQGEYYRLIFTTPESLYERGTTKPPEFFLNLAMKNKL